VLISFNLEFIKEEVVTIIVKTLLLQFVANF
jgi:hypothetical protein